MTNDSFGRAIRRGAAATSDPLAARWLAALADAEGADSTGRRFAARQPPTLARGRITIEGVRLRFDLRANAPGRQPIANVWPESGHDWPAVSEEHILGAIARVWHTRQQAANAQSA